MIERASSERTGVQELAHCRSRFKHNTVHAEHRRAFCVEFVFPDLVAVIALGHLPGLYSGARVVARRPTSVTGKEGERIDARGGGRVGICMRGRQGKEHRAAVRGAGAKVWQPECDAHNKGRQSDVAYTACRPGQGARIRSVPTRPEE